MTLDAEFVDAEYLDAEYARYMNAKRGTAGKRLDWSFWLVLALLALAAYSAAFVLGGHRASAASAATPLTMDLHDCSMPEVRVELARPEGAEHDMVAPYAHSTCREGDVRLWEALR